MSNARPRWVTARKAHLCDARHDYPYPCRPIQPGDRYARLVCFPGDVNTSRIPWVMRLCDSCVRSSLDPAVIALDGAR